MRALDDRGYRRFAVLAGPLHHLTARDRTAGYLDALDELGCRPDPGAVIVSEFTRDGGHAAMRTLLAQEPLAEVVLAVNDVMAVGAMAAAREAGVRVFGLGDRELFALTVLAALPTAQNIYVYAVRYRESQALASTTVLLSTALALPAIIIVTATLGG